MLKKSPGVDEEGICDSEPAEDVLREREVGTGGTKQVPRSIEIQKGGRCMSRHNVL